MLSRHIWIKVARVVVIALAAVLLLFFGARVIGAHRWRSETEDLRRRLDAARVPVHPRTVNFRELAGLPAPVIRYFHTVLEEGQPLVAAVQVRHEGSFNMSETEDRWSPFTSDQRVVTQRPGFDWNGRIEILPGVPVLVHDAYADGEGILHASVLGLVTVAEMRDTDNMARSELIRFFAEATWYPTSLLPSQGVRWEAVDDHSASAVLEEGTTSITLLFTFNEDGLVDTVRAETRGRTVGDELVPTSWIGRFWNYEERSGMRVPMDGEVAWLLPEGEKSYWRGHITEISYEFALPASGSRERYPYEEPEHTS